MDYVIQTYMPSSDVFYDIANRHLFFCKHNEILDKNYAKYSSFCKKLYELKKENKLRSFESLTTEEFYDLRVSMGLANKELYNLFEITKNKLSKAMNFHQVYCDARQMLSELIFGVREIDVDKFVAQLSC